MKKELDLTREIYNKKRKWALLFNWNYNRLVRPEWMKIAKDERFECIYAEQNLLLKKGEIMLARIVQTNDSLLKPGKYDCPARIVFSQDLFFEENPMALKEIVSKLNEIAGKVTDDEDLQSFSDILADDIVPVFNIEVPEKITFGKKVYYTMLMVCRKHLTLGYLDNRVLPILACPEKTEASIILPSKYWAPELKDAISRLNA